MVDQSLKIFGHNQRERLAFIDFNLFFLGKISRFQICQRFGIASAAATRDFSLYRGLAKANMQLDGTSKNYIPSEKFTPMFDHPLDRVLTTLSRGYVDRIDPGSASPYACEIAVAINQPSVPVLAAISRAISLGQALEIIYQSNSSGLTSREIVPFALVDNGLRWHVRAFDRLKQDFRDFVLTRISQPQTATRSPDGHETRKADLQWSHLIELELAPHPSSVHPQIAEKDFSMVEGVLRLQVRAAVAGYVLRRWSVDCSPNHELDCREHALCLRNRSVLDGVSNAILAPGMNMSSGIKK